MIEKLPFNVNPFFVKSKNTDSVNVCWNLGEENEYKLKTSRICIQVREYDSEVEETIFLDSLKGEFVVPLREEIKDYILEIGWSSGKNFVKEHDVNVSLINHDNNWKIETIGAMGHSLSFRGCHFWTESLST